MYRYLSKLVIILCIVFVLPLFVVSRAFAATPVGNFDNIDNVSGLLWGWAYDPDSSSTSIQVHVYADGPAGTGKFVGAVNANLWRGDVNTAFNITGNHGFNFTLPDWLKDGLDHPIYIHGIDTSGIGTQNVLISGSPKHFKNPQVTIIGRVVTSNTSTYWGNTAGKCGAGNFAVGPNLRVSAMRSTVTVDLCGPNATSEGPYYKITNNPTGKQTLTLTGLPSGYTCGSWAWGNFIQGQPSRDIKLGGGTFSSGKTTCTTPVLDIRPTASDYGQIHHIWFAINPPATPTPAPTTATQATPTPTSVRLTYTPAPTQIVATPTGSSVSCPISPLDVILMIDRSSSMWEKTYNNKTLLTWAKEAAVRFVDEFKTTSISQQGKVRVGVGSFASSATSTTPVSISANYSSILNAINAIPSGSTRSCIECGLYEANNKLKSAGSNGTNTRKVVILLSDGRANAIKGDSSADENVAGNYAIAEAVRGRGNGKYGLYYGYNIVYYVNGYGTKIGDPAVDIREWVLKGAPKDTSLGSLGIANGTGTPYYRYENTPSSWDNRFDDFQNNICANTLFHAQAGDAFEDVAGASTANMTAEERRSLFDDIVAYLKSRLLQ
jgi:hypothetical protein